jgi:hypothetical protein
MITEVDSGILAAFLTTGLKLLSADVACLNIAVFIYKMILCTVS